MKAYNKLTIFLLIFSLFFNSSFIYISAEESSDKLNDLYSLSAALIDGDSGRVLFEKDGYDIRAMASTTKIMTLIIALEYGNPDDIITVSSYAAKMPDVQLGIREGEQYKLYDLYYSLMLESHNDVAVAIAEHVGGSVEKFADMMNQKAKELGLDSTYFITPNGLDASDENGVHSTTAVDLARIMKYCVMESPQKEEFKRICQTRSYSFNDFNNKRSFNVSNKNTLLDMMDGVLAGKTGFTADAGYCYVAAVNHEGNTYIIALLGCGWPNNKSYKWTDTRKIIEYAKVNYKKTQITGSNTPMKRIDIPNGNPLDNIDTYITEYISLLVSNQEKVTLEYELPNEISPPVKKGDIVGNINILINDEIYSSIKVYAANSSYVKDYRYYLDTIINTIF